MISDRYRNSNSVARMNSLRFWLRKYSFEQQMCRQVDYENHEEPDHQQMHWRWPPLAMEERVGKCEIHIFLRGRESRSNENGKRDCRLQRPSSPVISETVEQPQKQHWQHQMIEREKANPERLPRIEEIFCPSD